MRIQIILGLILVLTISIGKTTMNAQNPYAALEKELAQYQEKRRPEKAAETILKIGALAEQRHDAPMLLHSTMLWTDPNADINDYPEEQTLERLESMEQKKWLRPADRAMIAMMRLRLYIRFISTNSYRSIGNTSEEIKGKRLSDWSSHQLATAFERDLKQLLTYRDALLKMETDAYRPVFEQKLKNCTAPQQSLYESCMEELVKYCSESYSMELLPLLREALQRDRDSLPGMGRRLAAAHRLLKYERVKKHLSDESYAQELDKLIAHYPQESGIIPIVEKRIDLFIQAEKYPQALELCDTFIGKYPQNPKINILRQIRETLILNPSLTATYPQIYRTRLSNTIEIVARNVGEAVISLYQTELDGDTASDLSESDYPKYTKGTPLLTETVLLKKREDMLADTTLYTLPALSRGVYIVKIAGGACTLPEATPQEKYGLIYASDLMLLTQTARPGVQLLDAHSGKPIRGASVNVSERYLTKKSKTISPSDEYGRMEISRKYGEYFPYTPEDTAHPRITDYSDYVQGKDMSSWPFTQMRIVSTDRTIYRPGQQVHFFGQCYKVGYRVEQAEVIPNQEVKVSLYDPNNEEIEKLTCQSDEMGRFSGSFTLPASGRLNGVFSIHTQSIGYYTFRVEEYKRPTFEVSVTSPTAAYALGDSLYIKGEAKSFTGIGLPGASVRYRLTARAFSRRWWIVQAEQEVIAEETAVTDAEGGFTLPISLVAPASLGEYLFLNYTLSVDVTAANGETQSSELRIPVGREPKRVVASVDKYTGTNAGKWKANDLPKLTFSLTNISGQTVEGSIDYFLSDSSGRPIGERYTTASGATIAAPTAWGEVASGQYRVRYGESGCEESAYENMDVYLFRPDDRHLLAPKDRLWSFVVESQYDERQAARILVGCTPEGENAEELYLFYDLTKAGAFIERKMIRSRSGEIVEIVPQIPANSQPENALVTLYYVYRGELHATNIELTRKQPKHELTLSWSSFRDKLSPGSRETWSLRIVDADGKPQSQAMLAAWMYDAALDNVAGKSDFYEQTFLKRTNVNSLITRDYPRSDYEIETEDSRKNNFWMPFKQPKIEIPQDCDWIMHPYFPDFGIESEIVVIGYGKSSGRINRRSTSVSEEMMPTLAVPMMAKVDVSDSAFETADQAAKETKVSLRTNFAETAFFEPTLRANERGEVSWSFTLPESLTRWHLFLYAHSKDMRIGMQDEAVEVRKEFMLTPNLPRFLRMNDRGTAAASIRNESEATQVGTVSMEIFDPATDRVLRREELPFTVAAGSTTTVSFPLLPIAGYDAVGVRIVAASAKFSDGEQHVVVQLPATERVVETIPLILHRGEPRTVDLDKLFPHRSGRPTAGTLALQVVSRPMWIALQALPVLATEKESNAIAVSSALYANSLTSALIEGRVTDMQHMGESIRKYLAQPVDTLAQKHPLSSDELPWRAEMLSEKSNRLRLQALVNSDSVSRRETDLIDKLAGLQKGDGTWAWYPEMQGSDYLTDYVMTMLVRLSALKAMPAHTKVSTMVQKGWQALDNAAARLMKDMQEQEKKSNTRYKVLPDRALNYLYLLTLDARTPDRQGNVARTYFLDILSRSLPHIAVMDMPRAAIVLNGVGRTALAQDYLQSIREHMIQTPEQGGHFALPTGSYYWCDRRYGLQTAAIEAFARIGTPEDNKRIESLQMWLLNQKRTQTWPTLPATADAVYALLLGNGSQQLADATVTAVAPTKELSDTFSDVMESRVMRIEELPAGKLNAELTRTGEGFAWASFLAEYDAPAEDLVATGNGLTVEKRLYLERKVDGRILLEPIREGDMLEVGTRLVTHLIIAPDRDMDFVVLTDKRTAAVEPIGQLSGYAYAAGTFYYCEIKDSSTRFFFDRLVRGTYKLEYATMVVRPGAYTSGIATVQCAYAPEFAGHTDGGMILQTTATAHNDKTN